MCSKFVTTDLSAFTAPIFAKRAEVVKGQTEAPADIQIEGDDKDETVPSGVPEFWLNVLRANEITASQVEISRNPSSA